MSLGSAAAGAVATACARPSSPSAASRSEGGRALASLGSTSESALRGMPSSPTEVFSTMRPAAWLPSDWKVAAVTFPVTVATRL